MKSLKYFLKGVVAIYFLIIWVSSVIAAGAPNIKTEEIRANEPKPLIRKTEPVKQMERKPALPDPDLAVIDIVIDSNCHLICKIKNNGGSITTDKTGLNVIFCDNNNICTSYVVPLTNLKMPYGQENTIPVAAVHGLDKGPYKCTIYPEDLPDSNASNNTLTKNPSANQCQGN